MASLVYGKGVNDADYPTQPKINGKVVACLYYRKWANMLERCYSIKLQERYPTYSDCTICDEWLTFSNFKAWMQKQDWEGKHLDKDLLIQGNKVYSPETCIFIDSKINKLLNTHKSKRGVFPQGVCFHKATGKYQARVSFNGKKKYIGEFETPDDAFEAYKEVKYTIIKDVALKQAEPLKSALLNYKIKGESDG